MGAMGRYIEQLNGVGRDRLIQATNWSFNGSSRGAQDAPKCLMEHGDGSYIAYRNSLLRMGVEPGACYDKATIRFGRDRVVRSIKIRAARLNGCDPKQIAALLHSAPEIAIL